MNKDDKKINVKRINEVVIIGNKVLRILFILFIILLIYVGSLILKDWGVLSFIGKIISVISPLFIGYFIAWLLNPLVNKLMDKGLNRTLSVVACYILLIMVIYLLFAFTIPSLASQMTDIVSSIPSLVEDIKGWIDEIFLKFSNLSLQNLDSVKENFLNKLVNFATGIEQDLPNTIVNIVSSIVSGIGNILLSLIIGFYILFGYDKFVDNFIKLFPKKYRSEVKELSVKLSNSLFSYVNGTLWLSLLLFVVSIIGFSIIGLNAPVLVALICVITNLIPYIGPYIGAAIAGIIGFAETPLVGILTLIFILVVQTIEGNFLQPLVMSKKMNLSPITIIISLLIFGYFFGILGMVLATPIVAIIKVLYEFFDDKYKFFERKEEE